MPYNANIPQPTDQLSVSQGQILANFQAIKTLIDVNHVDFASPNQGMHAFVQMPAGVPIIATAAAQIGLYAKNGVSSGVPELYFQRQSKAANTGYAITEFGTGNYTSVVAGQTNVVYIFTWTRLPSGLLMLWGTQTNTGPNFNPNTAVVKFPTATSFPGFSTAVYNVGLTLQWNDVTGANSDQPLVIVQGATTLLKFEFTRQSTNQYPTKGSVSFTAVGI